MFYHQEEVGGVPQRWWSLLLSKVLYANWVKPMWMVTVTTHWGRLPCHYVYSELLCEEWLSRLGSVLTAVL